MTIPPLSPGLVSELACWREAWRLRRQNPRWVVFWDAGAGRYGAYRLSRARRDAILAAATPGDLASQIEQADQARHGVLAQAQLPGSTVAPSRSTSRT